MFKSNSISLVASLALAGSLTLVGCGDNSSTEATNASSTATDSSKQKGVEQTGSISGKVSFVNNPTDRTIRTDATVQVVAYNLDDDTSYTTTSTSNGEYDLSGLTEGNYQVVASSTSTTMKSIRQVSVERNTRAVLDIVLQATGIIKGTVSTMYPGTFVTVPGTSYISSVDSSGNFELINVPAGDVTVAVGGELYYTQNVTVVGGETATITFESTDVGGPVDYFMPLETGSTLEMKHDGIAINMDQYYTLSEFSGLVSLVAADGTEIDIEVEFNYSWYDENDNHDYFRVRTTSVVDPGTYTLNIATDEPYSKNILLEDKVAVFSDSYTKSGGVYTKGLGIAFSNPTDLNTSAVSVTYVDDANVTQTLNVTAVEPGEFENEYMLVGDYEADVMYKVVLDSSIAESGLFYVGNDDFWYADGITVGETEIDYVTVDDGEEGVETDRDIYFKINHSDALDLQTLKVTLGEKELTVENGGLSNRYTYNGWSDYLYVDVNAGDLGYSQEVNMTITANDSYGDNVISESLSFTTITPATVGVTPYVTNEEDYWEILYYMQDTYTGFLRAYFNVPVDFSSGAITLHDNTNNKDVELVPGGRYTNSNDTDTPYYFGANPVEFLPNTEYTMTVSGFTAEDGTALATKTNTFKTPPRMIMMNSVRNGILVRASDLNNRIEFGTFGVLTDAEKDSLVNGLDITSFNAAMTADATHPEPLALWEDNEYGSKLVLAFTIEAGKSYELAFSGDVADELGMTSSPLTFMTQSDSEMNSGDFTPSLDIVNNFYTYSNQDSNLSVKNDVEGYASVKIPYIVDEAYSSDSYSKCSDLNYKNYYNYSGYDNAPDINSSVIAEWISGDDVNVTSTSLSYISYNSQSMYDENGIYIDSYYVCNVTYNADFTFGNDVNTSASIDVVVDPTSELVADNFTPVDTNATVMNPYYADADANVNIYSNGFNIYFSKPVSVSSLQNLVITTNPDLSVAINTPYSPYYDASGEKYTTSVSGSFDSSAYSVFEYDINSTVTYYNTASQSTGDLALVDSGIVYTSADLTPLEAGVVTTADNAISIEFNRAVDTDGITSVFTLENNDTTSDVNATVTDAYSTSYSLELAVTRSDDNGTNCYDAQTFVLTQTGLIKANGSTQSLASGSINETITLPAKVCP